MQVGHHAQDRQAGALLEHLQAVFEQPRVAAELVDDEAFDARAIGAGKQLDGAEQGGEDAPLVDIADDYNRRAGHFGDRPIDQVAMAQVDFRRPAGSFDHDQIEVAGQALVAVHDFRPGLRAIPFMLHRVHVETRAAADHHLASRLAVGLEQHRIHIDGGLQSARLSLRRLGAANLTAGADGGVVRHVLRLEGCDPDSGAQEGPAQCGHHHALARVRRGPHDHQALGAHDA